MEDQPGQRNEESCLMAVPGVIGWLGLILFILWAVKPLGLLILLLVYFLWPRKRERTGPSEVNLAARVIGWLMMGLAALAALLVAGELAWHAVLSALDGQLPAFLAANFPSYLALEYPAPLTAALFLAFFFLILNTAEKRPVWPGLKFSAALAGSAVLTIFSVWAVNEYF